MSDTAPCVPKILGADAELGNFVLGLDAEHRTGAAASRALLSALAANNGVAGPLGGDPRLAPPGAANAQDWARVYLPANGGCAYIDLDHLELCIPEVRSAGDFVAAWHAMLRIALGALDTANAGRARYPIHALVNNSDGRGNSYGSHLNVMVSRTAWNDLLERKPHHQAFLAAHQISSLVLFGQGKVGSENGRPPAPYQLSQRADFIEVIAGPQTTYRRPLINSRDEPLCGDRWDSPLADRVGPATGYARLHVICYDSTLCHTATYLKTGALQIVLAMLEAGAIRNDLALDDPLPAVQAWSADPTLETRAELVDGRAVTAVELQLLIAEAAERFVAGGRCDGIVPGAADIVARWLETLECLRRADWATAARRLDWATKLALLERAMARRPDLDWDSPAIKYLDHLYASLDPKQGLYWNWEASGLVDRLATEGDIARFTDGPPIDTRAWGRAMLLRRAGPREVDRVDWDHVRFRLRQSDGRTRTWRATLADPTASTRADLEPAVEFAETLEELLRAIGAAPDDESWTGRSEADQTTTWHGQSYYDGRQ